MTRTTRLLAIVCLTLMTAGLGGLSAHAASSPPTLTWSPATTSGAYDFGTLSAGSTASQTFTLTNTGGKSSGALTVALSGSSAFTITSDTCGGTALGSNKSCTVTVQYAPTASGESDSATLTATGEHANARIILTGQGATVGCVVPSTTYPTIQSAVNDLFSCPTIQLLPGIYHENVTINRNVTIQGAGAGQTIVDGAYGVGSVFRITGYTTTLSGLTIRNGSGFSGDVSGLDGGGINNYNANLTVTNSTISNNGTYNTSFGGGIYTYGGTVTVTNSTITGNRATAYGGGIYNQGGTVTVSNSTISNNGANTTSDIAGLYGGGGIFNDGGTVTVTNNSTISGNDGSSGGGIYNHGGGTLTVTNSTITGNTPNNCATDPSGGGTITGC